MLDFNQIAPIYDFSLVEKAVQEFFINLPVMTVGGATAAIFVKPADEDDPHREKWTPPAASIPFYTPAQALVLQSCRPRVGILETNFSEYPAARILDADGVYRASAWKGTLKFAIITECSYKLHRQLRAAVMAILPTLQPLPTGDIANVGATGVNAYLQFHEVGQFAMQSGDTDIKPGNGYYLSTLSVNLTFSARISAWSGNPAVLPPLPYLPFAVVNGQLIPLDTGVTLKIWDSGKLAFQYFRVVNGQYQITDA